MTAEETEIVSDYVRPRHCVRYVGDFAPIIEGLDYHLLQNGHKVEREHLVLLRDLLVAGALHHASRPRNEMTGWTVNLVEPRINLFVTGDTENGIVCGRVFTENVKENEEPRLHAQTTRPRFPLRQSIVEVTGSDPFVWARQFYEKSEQLPVRFFHLEGRVHALLVAHTGYDEKWFRSVGPEDVAAIAKHEELGPLERRLYHFGCGCDVTIIRRIVKDAAASDLDGFFEGEEQLRVVCPRCAAVFFVKRADMDG
jgi:molecular chaperone Hsp33